jgi:predicted transcriptional regulator
LTKIPLICYHVVKNVIIGGNMVRTQIQLTEEQAKTLRKLASSRHLSIAELIRRAVDHLIKSNTVVDTGERRKRAIDAAGRFGSGVSDVSTAHDKHLVEAFQR